jgi:hypothetical protein
MTPYQQKFSDIQKKLNTLSKKYPELTPVSEEIKELQEMIENEVIPLYERLLDESTEHLMRTQKERNQWQEKYNKVISK